MYPEGRKNGTRKDMCFKKKKRRKQTEKGKRKREMKNRSLKKSEAKTNQRRETRREKGEGREEVCQKRKMEVVQKGSEKTFFFSKLNAIRKNENIICPKREDTFFPTKKLLAQDEDWKNISWFFKERVTKKKRKMFQYFSFFFWYEKNETEE